MDADRIADKPYVLPSESATLSLPPNILAGLGCIRACEGTGGPNGYRMIFGGGLFDDMSQHPNIAVTFVDRKGITRKSTAAGAYQQIFATWTRLQVKLALPDFTPPSQDRAAIELIHEHNAYDALAAGDLWTFVQRCSTEWASLPASTYAQPVRTWDFTRTAFVQCGGVMA